MNIVICHLSDIHFKNGYNPISEKFEKIANVIKSNLNFGDACFIVFSGDIAFSGKSQEYEYAIDFVGYLEKAIADRNKIFFVAVPGNHDCDFNLSSEDDTRDDLIHIACTKNNPGKGFIDNCTSVQADFLKFREVISDVVLKGNLLHSYQDFNIQGKRIVFNLFNTAWISQKNEIQGSLYFPLGMISDNDISDFDLSVSVFHHPYNWLESNNAREFRQSVEGFSDLIFTGHEHTEEHYTVNRASTNNEYYAGGVLQDGDQSDFNLCLIDLDSSMYSFKNYRWNTDMYQPQNCSDWKAFRRNKVLDSEQFIPNQEYSRQLSDIGAAFVHPKKDILLLEDIFIYPELRMISNEDFEKDFKSIKSDKVKEFVLEKKKILFIGEDQCGKTALAKTLYIDLNSLAIIPIMLTGRDIPEPTTEKVWRSIQKNFEFQYSSSLFERFRQLPSTGRAIILDDFDKSRLSTKAKSNLLNYLFELFDYVLIFANSQFQIEQLYNRENNLIDITNCLIREFGYYLRSKLITKWYNLGSEFYEVDNNNQIVEVERTINDLLGKNFLPSYPVFILLIIQQLEAIQSKSNNNLSSYGYLYESLITRNMAQSVTRASDIDTYYTFLSELAFYLYNQKSQIITKEEFYKLTQQYNSDYEMQMDFQHLIDKFNRFGILQNISTSEFIFKYKYMYYYFVAKYFANHINETRIKDEITLLCDKLHNEQYANIVMFLCHLSKDPFIIDALLQKAKELFAGIEAYDFDMHINFINQMYIKIPEIAVSLEDPKDNRQKALKQRDEIERTIKDDKDDDYDLELTGEGDDDESNEIMNELLLMNKAFKTIEITGQVVKNFPGSLKGEVKYQAILECYQLGMRTLNAFLEKINDNIDVLVTGTADLLREKESLTEDKLLERSKNLILRLTEYISVGSINRIAESVGNSNLVGTYRSVLENNNSTSFNLIDVAVKLECLNNFPLKEVLQLGADLKSNIFSLAILRDIVVNHFYLYECEFKVKQAACSGLGIPYNEVKLLGSSVRR